MAFDIKRATNYVAAIDLTGTRRRIVPQGAEEEAKAVFDLTKAQAQVVGSGIFSFAVGVDNQVREAISDSALLAQLKANLVTSFSTDPEGWFNTYAEVLQNVGWAIQDMGDNRHEISGQTAEVHEAILDVLTVALGPTPAALALIKATMGALKKLNPDSSWLTLFKRESQKARIARFQVGLVEKDPGGDVFVSLLAFVVRAKSDMTQVLFFKYKVAKAKVQAYAQKVSINRASLVELGPAIRQQVSSYQKSYVSNLLNLPQPPA